jgi:16S rRNA (cytosine967-C5)-methyltransferase
VLRHREALDRRVAPFLGSRSRTVPAELRDVLRIGAYQIEYLDRVPTYAAVHTAVEMAKRAAGRKRGGLVNAILRRMLREPASEPATKDLASIHSHPAWLVDRWLRRFGPERTEALLRHNNTRPPLAVQPIGTDRANLRARLERSGIAVRDAPFDAGLIVEAGDVRTLPGYADGAFIVQDPAQAHLLAHSGIPADCTVWDACAAPGGKTVQLSGTRRVIASDLSARRYSRLVDTVTRTGADVSLMRADAARPPLSDEAVDVVVVDAPCSATGTMARHPDARWRLSQRRIAALVDRQRTMLDGVARVVRRGGLLVYLTCSLEPEENEAQVNGFLQRHPEFAREGDDLAVFPPIGGTDGGFAARLRKHA